MQTTISLVLLLVSYSSFSLAQATASVTPSTPSANCAVVYTAQTYTGEAQNVVVAKWGAAHGLATIAEAQDTAVHLLLGALHARQHLEIDDPSYHWPGGTYYRTSQGEIGGTGVHEIARGCGHPHGAVAGRNRSTADPVPHPAVADTFSQLYAALAGSTDAAIADAMQQCRKRGEHETDRPEIARCTVAKQW